VKPLAQIKMIQLITTNFSRYQQLEKELHHALKTTSKEELRHWAKCTALVFPKVTIRRAINLAEVTGYAAKGTLSEAKNAINASLEWRLRSHTKQRAVELSVFASESYNDVKNLSKTIKNLLRVNPKKTGTQMLMSVLGFNIGGGGLDGDGGIPDLDLLFSIGHHRSILTHSVLPMIILEGLCISLIGLVNVVHSNLPERHDPLWDDMKSSNKLVLESFFTGMSLGLAYHLGVDGTLHGDGSYKNLPFSMPKFGHQLIAGVNSLTELIDTTRSKIFKSNLVR